MTVDVLFLAWNRYAFTKAALACLLANTEWEHVRRLVIYDDGSVDGTLQLLQQMTLAEWPVPVELRDGDGLGPVGIMRDYLRDDPADWFAKVDSDAAMPVGWLAACLDVLDRDPSIDLLGMEAGMTAVAGRDGVPFDGTYGFQESSHIGGIGLMRADAFTARRPLVPDGRNGFTEWQHHYQPRRGWITPDLPVVLLDRLPIEPWAIFSARYEAAGWQRPWGRWTADYMEWAWEWFAHDFPEVTT